MTPERRAARAMARSLTKLAEAISKESSASGVLVNAMFHWTRQSGGTIGLKLSVSSDAKMERSGNGPPMPYGTRLQEEAEAALKEMKEELK